MIRVDRGVANGEATEATASLHAPRGKLRGYLLTYQCVIRYVCCRKRLII